jgi:hypothetical protein
MPNNGYNNMPMNDNMGGDNMPMNDNMDGGNMPINDNIGGGNMPMNDNMGGGNMPMNGNMGGGYNNGYNMNNNNFQISDYVSTRTEQTFESAPFFSMLTPQEQQELASMLQGGSMTKQQRAMCLMHWSSTLPSNAQVNCFFGLNHLNLSDFTGIDHCQGIVAKCQSGIFNISAQTDR